MPGEVGTGKGDTYKASSRSGIDASREVGTAHSTVDGRDNRTRLEGRSRASVGVIPSEDGVVTVERRLSPQAQRTNQKLRVLQATQHRAAKKDLKRTFGILYDKIYRWEVLWTAWYQVRVTVERQAWMAAPFGLSKSRGKSDS